MPTEQITNVICSRGQYVLFMTVGKKHGGQPELPAMSQGFTHFTFVPMNTRLTTPFFFYHQVLSLFIFFVKAQTAIAMTAAA
jgi:hypothetical protein